MVPRELAESLMNQGFAVLPLRVDKSPVTHLVPQGFRDASKNPEDLWWFEHLDTEMVGIVPGSKGYIVLDVDIKSSVNGLVELRKITPPEHIRLNGEFDFENIVRTRSGGYHIYLGKPLGHSTEHVGNHDLCPGVNVRSDAGYVVAPGNPGYDWHRGNWGLRQYAPDWVMERLRAAARAEAEAKLDEPYSAPEARLEPFEEAHPKVIEAFDSFDPRGDRHTSMTEAVAALCSYELLGYPAATTALRELEEVFIEAVADRAGEAEARREYRRALEGGRRRVRANVSVVKADQDKNREFIEAIIRDHGGSEEDVEKVIEATRPSALKLWTMRELMTSDLTLNWLVRNVLVTPTYGQIAGEQKTLKTYLSQYLALAVATGEKFLKQFDVEKQGSVVMFVGEGGRIPWTRRMPRIAQSMGIDDIRDVPIYSVFQVAPILSPQFKATIEDAIERLDPVLTIIDPLYSFHGAETNAANIHEEGALLTAVSAPFVEHQSNLMIVNHFKKGSDNRGLKRITMAGSGEWVDSWIFTSEREAPDLNDGDFYITVEFGSRQWGGSRWDIDFNIGRQDPMGMESDEPITFNIRPSLV
jgi:hypothetical protein